MHKSNDTPHLWQVTDELHSAEETRKHGRPGGIARNLFFGSINFYCTILQSNILAAWRHWLQLVHKIIFRDWFWKGICIPIYPRRYARGRPIARYVSASSSACWLSACLPIDSASSTSPRAASPSASLWHTQPTTSLSNPGLQDAQEQGRNHCGGPDPPKFGQTTPTFLMKNVITVT